MWPIRAIQQVWLIVQTVQSYQQMWSRLHCRLPVCCLTVSSRWQQHISETNRTEGHKMWSGQASPQDVCWWRQNVINVCFFQQRLLFPLSVLFHNVWSSSTSDHVCRVRTVCAEQPKMTYICPGQGDVWITWLNGWMNSAMTAVNLLFQSQHGPGGNKQTGGYTDK